MARYKPANYDQMELIPVSFDEQIIAGTFEHTLSFLIDNKIDLSIFESKYYPSFHLNRGFCVLDERRNLSGISEYPDGVF